MKETIIILSHANSSNSIYSDYVHSHAIELRKMGYNVIVFACVNTFPFLSIFSKTKKRILKKNKGIKEIDGVKIIYKRKLSISKLFYNSCINFNGLFYYLAIKKEVKKLIKKENVILIDAHTFKVEGYAAYKLKNKFNIPTFVTCHGTSFNDSFKTKNGKKMIKKVGGKIDRFICVSDKICNQLKSIKINNANVVYNGINFYNKKNVERKNNIITVGGLNPVKNIDLVIESFKELKKEFSDLKLTIIGSGALEENLKRLAGNDKNIIFMNQISNEEVYEKLQQNLIFILPSKPEGFGIVYAEAMYNGCITIGTKNEGIDGFIKNDQNGFLVNVDKMEIVELIKNILSNPSKYKELQQNAVDSAKNLTWKLNAQKYIELLGDIYDR